MSENKYCGIVVETGAEFGRIDEKICFFKEGTSGRYSSYYNLVQKHGAKGVWRDEPKTRNKLMEMVENE